MHQSLLMILPNPDSVALQIALLATHRHKFAVEVGEALLFSSQVIGLFKKSVPELGSIRSSHMYRNAIQWFLLCIIQKKTKTLICNGVLVF